MPSPFPGMDPYLEGHLWPDVHQRLAGEISRQLSPMIRPRYVTRLAVATVEDEALQPDIGLMYPDVEVLRASTPGPVPVGPTAVAETPAIAPETGVKIAPPINIRLAEQDRFVTVEVYDLEHNQLVTSIEIVSPSNKREPGLRKFSEKRERLRRAGVHLLDIDLLRGGQRLLPPLSEDDERIKRADYLITLLRRHAQFVEVWPVGLADPLPVVAAPLRHPDPDVPLDLASILRVIYEEAAYDLTINYRADPPPPRLTDAQDAWLLQQLRELRR